MKMRMTAAMLACVAGQAMGQVTIDGEIDATEAGLYNLNWINNQPTSFGDNTPQMSTDDDVDDAALASTGVEIKIPLAQLADDMDNVDAISFIAFINGGGHDFVANQVTGGLGNGVGNPGEPRNVSWAASSPTNPDGFDGVQTLAVSGLVGSTMAPALDGAEDATYGPALFVQNTGTGFGNSDNPSALVSNGSEINEAFAVIVDENDDGMVDAGDSLYILLTGNLETNFNKLDVFIDSIDGEGQAVLRGDNPDVDFGGLNRMGDNGGDDGLLDGADLGMEFESGFDADFWFSYTTGDAGGDGTTDAFMSAARLLTGGGGDGGFLGGSEPDSLNITSTAGAGEFGEGIMVTCDQSNVSGVGSSGFVAPAPDPDFANGSEFNALYTYLDEANGKLNIMLTGNLESNFNRLYLFVDADPNEGQNIMRDDNLDIAGRLNRMGSQELPEPVHHDNNPPVVTPGLTWDGDFAPDYVILMSTGSNPVALFADAAVLRANGPLTNFGFIVDYGSYDGGDKAIAGNNPVLFDGDRTDGDFEDGPVQIPSGSDVTPRSNLAPRQSQIQFPSLPAPGLLQVALNNLNVEGITDMAADPSAAQAVTTGVEVQIDFDELLPGMNLSEAKIGGFIINGDGFFVSNQVLGGLPAADELGEVSQIDFSMIDGNQFVSTSDTVMSGPTRLCADVNGDGNLTGADFNGWLSAFSNMTLASDGSFVADINQDGNLTGADFNAFLTQFSAGPAGALCPDL